MRGAEEGASQRNGAGFPGRADHFGAGERDFGKSGYDLQIGRWQQSRRGSMEP